MCACDELIRLVRKQARVLRHRANLFHRMQTGIEEGDTEKIRNACQQMGKLEKEHSELSRNVLRALRRACVARNISGNSATLGRLLEEVNGELEKQLAGARRDLAGAIATARRAADSVRRLASLAAEWNSHVLDAIFRSVPAGQTYSSSGEMDSGEGRLLQGLWG